MDDFYSFLYETPAPQPQAQLTLRAEPVYTQPATVKSEKKKHTALGIVALALACSLLGGALGAGAMALVNPQKIAEDSTEAAKAEVMVSNRESAELELVQVDSGKELTPAEVYAKNVNSTVGITTEIQSTNLWGYRSTSAAAGSGFIITEDGYILTNYHVVEDASSITVTTYEGQQYEATLIGYDESNDVAVLKVDADGLTPVVLGDSDVLNVGDKVMAIGNPLGELTFSLTTGVVSALERAITMENGTTMTLIQTDAAINSGNSGGALFNAYGEVVGITNAKYSSSGYGSEAEIDNIGFAIPMNSVLNIVSSILEKGYYAHPYLGVTIGTVSSEEQTAGMPAGAVVQAVQDGSPAAEAGLQENDVITSVNGEAIRSGDDLVELISQCEVGDMLAVTVYRQGETKLLTVVVGEKPQTAQTEQQESQQPEEEIDPWGWGYGGFGGFGGFGG